MKSRLLNSTSPIALSLYLSAGVLVLGSAAAQAQTVIGNGTTVSTPVALTGSQTLTVEAGGALETGNASITQSGAATSVIVNNSGTIHATGASSRAFDTSGGSTVRNITINNFADALIKSDRNDAVRINTNITSGSVNITNSGTILANAPTATSSVYTEQGQALDLRTINTAGVAVTITNEAGGIIRAMNDDALRPSLNARIYNYGLIDSYGPNTSGGDNGTSDGIDIGGRDGVEITNGDGGTISGARSGIVADEGTYSYITNGGDIIGRNGAGIGLAGSGFILNSGTITGAYAGAGNIFDSNGNASLNGDGDGINVDALVTIDNSGTIQGTGAGGVDSGGNVNVSEGIAAGGGLILNRSGATISGSRGILIDDGAGGSGVGSTALYNAGTITGSGGAAVTVIGVFNDTIVNSGIINGAIDMGAGNDNLTIRGGSITGSVAGGSGTDSLVFDLVGDSTLTPSIVTAVPSSYDSTITMPGGGFFIVSSAYTGFENVAIQSGTVTIAEGGSLGTTVNISGESGLVLDEGATLENSGIVVNWNGSTSGTGVSIDNSGTMHSTNGRTIDSSGGSGTLSSRVLTLTNRAGGLIQSDNSDTIRINSNIAGGSVSIVNAGTILASAPTSTSTASTVQGQAIDLRTMNTAGVTLSITNQATGIIRAMNDDALRPGLNATIDNYGLIESFGANTSGGDYGTSDGIDIGGRDGVHITNRNGGTISGARHAITADEDTYTYVTNEAGGTITGRNGSGVGLDGAGSVINYGTITGAYAGAGNIFDSNGNASLNGDGDGVDIDGLATITNYGTIQGTGAGGVDSGGRPNGSEGIAAGGGTIDNQVGGVIIGVSQGILVDDGAGGSGVGATTITNAGTITGQNGAAITLVGTFDDQVSNSGTISGGGSDPVAVSMGAGNDSLTLYTGSSTNGSVDGGADTDSLYLAGTGTGTLDFSTTPVSNFEKLVKQDNGTWTLSGSAATFSDGIWITLGTLVSSTESLGSNAIVDNGTLVLDQSSAGTLTQGISGSGSLIKRGTGTVTLAGVNTYTGDTLIEAGKIILTGSLPSAVSIQADGTLQVGDGVTAGDLTGSTANNGTLVFAQPGDYTYTGALSGSGSLVKQGTGLLILTGDYDYTGSTIVLGGSIQLDADLDPSTGLVIDGGTFDLGGRDQTVSGLSGTSGVLQFSGGSLTADQSSDSEFGGDFSGNGDLIKTGAGRLNLTGSSGGFTGNAFVQGGRLSVNGDFTGMDTTVQNGGTLGGNGTIDTLIVQSGGNAAPGNSIGNLHVAGNVNFATGSIYTVEVDATGASDKITAAGAATISGGTVMVTAAAGSYAPSTNYTILTAATGVSGAFDDVISDLAFLDPTLTYGANDVVLTLTRNSVGFTNVGITSNQIAVGGGVESLGSGTIYSAIVGLSASAARDAFDQLSGEIHASAQTALIEDSHFVRDAITSRLRFAFGTVGTAQGAQASATNAPAFWGQAFGSWGHVGGDGNSARLDRTTGGFLAGLDGEVLNNGRLGVIGGYSHTSFDANSRHSSGSSENYHVGVYGGAEWGAFAFRSGLAYSWHDMSTSRNVTFAPAFSDRLKGDYSSGTVQAFGEIGYDFNVGGMAFEPYANLAHVHLDTDGFTEKGGEAALSGQGSSMDTTFTTIGIRAATDIALGDIIANARGTLGWRHAFGDTTPSSSLALAGGDIFTVAGTAVAKDAAVIDFGLDFKVSPNAALGVSYSGQFSDKAAEQSFKANLAVKF